MKGVLALGLRCKPSPTLVCATLVVAVLAIAATLAAGLPHWAHACLIALVGAYTGVTLARTLRPQVTSMLWRADGGVEINLRDTTLEDGRVLLGSVSAARVLGPLIVLTLRWPVRGRTHLWLLPDNLDADTRRRLRMRLASGIGALASGNADSG